MSLDPDLSQLAAQYGLETSFIDSFGHHKIADAEAVVQVLRCLGAAIERPDQASAALAARRAEVDARVLEPVNVVWDGEPARLALRLSTAEAGQPFVCTINLESGEERRLEGNTRELTPAAPDANGDGIGPKRWVELGAVPHGYHSLRLELGPRVLHAALFSAPVRAHGGPEARYWGAFAPTYALRSEASWGAGDFGDLGRLVSWVGARGGNTVATLPLLPSFLSTPFDPSPYAPVSRLFWNEFYLDVLALPERESEAGRAVLADPAVAGELAALRASSTVQYRALAALKRRVVERFAAAFFASGGERDPRFAAYLEQPRVRDYAAFRATFEARGESWQTWPEHLKTGALKPTDYRLEDYRYHLYSQWRTTEQLERLGEQARGLGLGLYLDLPVGVHGSGYDLWAERDAFLLGCAAGAPPDIVFQGGQDWGLAPLSPEGLRTQAYRYFRDMIAHHLRVAGALRIDHVMGLHRIYCVPYGLGARRGIYVRYRAEELYAVLALESARHRSLLVGEDLGTVPPEVPPSMERHNIRRMHVLEYAMEADHLTFDGLGPAAVASINTHDLFPFGSWWDGEDIEDRRRSGVIDARGFEHARGKREWMKSQLVELLQREGRLQATDTLSVLAAVLEKYGESQAPLILANLEDLWLERSTQNVPGTGPEENWRHRAARTLEQLEREPELGRPLDRLARARQRAAG